MTQVAGMIRDRILDGTYCTEATLPAQGELAESIGVSRTVIREAMGILSAEGLLEIRQGRVPRVKGPDGRAAAAALRALVRKGDDLLLHLVEVRAPLECQIAELAALRHREEGGGRLKQAIVDLEQAKTVDAQVEADGRFHATLAELTGNPLFSALLSTINELLVISRRRTIARAGPVKAMKDHRRILRCVIRRDGVGARREMLRHLNNARVDLLKTQQELP